MINTVPPSDETFFDLLNQVVQEQPSGTLSLEITGSFAAIGIVKGKKFQPDARMKGLLKDAAALGDATGRALAWRFRDEDGLGYYPDSAWMNGLFVGGSGFQTPPPEVKDGQIVPYAPTGYRTLNARDWFFYIATGVTPAMCMKLTGMGSQYLVASYDSKKEYFDGAKNYKCTLPANIPEANFWSFTVYSNQTRSMLQTPQRFPRAGSQSFPSPAAVANADGTYDIYFGPQPPVGKESNWIQTMPGKGWFTILRLYSPLEPFFDKSWKVGEVEEIS